MPEPGDQPARAQRAERDDHGQGKQGKAGGGAGGRQRVFEHEREAEQGSVEPKVEQRADPERSSEPAAGEQLRRNHRLGDAALDDHKRRTCDRGHPEQHEDPSSPPAKRGSLGQGCGQPDQREHGEHRPPSQPGDERAAEHRPGRQSHSGHAAPHPERARTRRPRREPAGDQRQRTRHRRNRIAAIDLDDRWAQRNLLVCFAAEDALPTVVEEFCGHLARAAGPRGSAMTSRRA
jgi:hypothetical protein